MEFKTVYLTQLAQRSIRDYVKQYNAVITRTGGYLPTLTACESLYSVRYALRQKQEMSIKQGCCDCWVCFLTVTS